MANIFTHRLPVVVTATREGYNSASMISSYPRDLMTARVFTGVDNRIDVLLRNIDRKPVVLGVGETVRFSVFDQARARLLFQGNLDTVDATDGHFKIEFTAAQVNAMPLGTHLYAFTAVTETTETLLYADRSYAASATFEVALGPIVTPPVAIEMLTEDFITDLGISYSSALTGALTLGNITGVQTAMIYTTAFNGYVTMQGAVGIGIPSLSEEWFDIETINIVSSSATVTSLTGIANVNWIRFKFYGIGGSIERIIFRAE